MLWNAFILAVREIRRNVMRSFLTVLGIVIGVAAVIIMVTVGGGATIKVTEDIESLGSNLLLILPGQRMGPAQGSVGAAFDLGDAEAIEDQIGAARAVAPQATRPTVAVYGNRNWSTTVAGVTSSYFDVRDWVLVGGRDFLGTEHRAGKAVCIIGDTVRKELYGTVDPVGQNIRLGRLRCEVIGLLEGKGQSSMGNDQDNTILIPLRTFHRRISGNQNVAMIQVSVRDGTSTEKAKRDIEELFRERRRISSGEDDDFSVMDMKEIAGMLAGTTQILTIFLSAVASVSLLVGGIGIMNIMLVSVTERTREIGTRLAIGALEREVLLQFLVEAVVLAALGGLLGILLALAASYWLAGLMSVPFAPNIVVIGASFFFAATVGMVFGFFPARRAAQLDPIDALRHE